MWPCPGDGRPSAPNSGWKQPGVKRAVDERFSLQGTEGLQHFPDRTGLSWIDGSKPQPDLGAPSRDGVENNVELDRLNRCAIIPLFLSAGLTAGLWLAGEAAFGACSLAVTVLSFLVSRGFSREISKAGEMKRRLDEQLARSRKLAAIGEFSSGIAHEINNPLAIIGQEVEWIGEILKTEQEDPGKGTEEIRDSMREISRQIHRCGEITHKLLDFARGREPLIQATDINRLVEDMARLVEKDAGHRNIRIVREFQEDLAPVYTDPPLMRQVILNLLKNAGQAIGEKGCITVGTTSHGNGSVDIVVKDTGCGIPGEHLEKIFDPFFTTKSSGKGTGLGLSICHGIVGKLGGTISVVSEVGRGSSFTVHLPARSGGGEE